MTNYWLLIGDEDSWNFLSEKGIWAVGGRWRKIVRKLSVGDRAVAYVRFKLDIYGIFTITSKVYYDSSPILGEDIGTYPHRFKIKADLILEEPASIKILINNLDFIKNKERWFSYFQTSIREISQKDFEEILSYITKKT